MELRSRSRSSTPYQTQNFIEAESFESSNHVTVTRSTRKSTSLRSSEGFYTKPIKAKSTKSIRNIASNFKTSDYSSEEGDIESMTHMSQNERNQIIEDAKAAANGTAEISALNLYRRAGRYWDKYPKTDYTYSVHSRDRVEIAPGVVQMPNMSRRTIHSYDSSTNTDSYYDKFASGSRYVKQRLFSSPNNNNQDEIDENFKISRVSTVSKSWKQKITTTITSFFVSIYTVIYWLFRSVYNVQNSTVIWFAKKIHHLTSRLMLLDTWLLKKSHGGKRTRAVIALCLLPLLLFTVWWLLSFLGSAVYSSYINPSEVPLVTEAKIPLIIEEEPLTQPPRSKPEPKIDNFADIKTDEIVDRVLQSPKIYNIISNYYNDVRMEQQSESEKNAKLVGIIEELKEEIGKVKAELVLLEQTKNADLHKIVSQFRTENIRNIAQLTQKLNRCCNKPMINLEPHISKVLSNLLNDPDFLSNQKGLSDWLHVLFIAKENLEGRLSLLTQNLTKNYETSVANTAKLVMEEVMNQLSDHRFDSDTITEEKIKKIVKSSLMIYDADKTGLVDYAMEPMGGQIVTTRCTESYHSGTAVISVLGVPIWYPTNSPRIVIDPGINPGECWAFQNFPGFIVIKLANKIKVEAFSVEHISKLLVPNGKIDSAPKEFEVYGLNDENDKDPVKIGEYLYDYNGDSIQYFAAQQYGLVFPMVEVRIKSNHGNPNYTCLYRFRVHGTLSNEPT